MILVCMYVCMYVFMYKSTLYYKELMKQTFYVQVVHTHTHPHGNVTACSVWCNDPPPNVPFHPNNHAESSSSFQPFNDKMCRKVVHTQTHDTQYVLFDLALPRKPCQYSTSALDPNAAIPLDETLNTPWFTKVSVAKQPSEEEY